MSNRSHEKSKGIVVLGMHRSGTSLTAHLLGELGCSYGGQLVEARADNPLGYWEHAGVVAAHNEFLESLRRRWDDPRALTREHFDSAAGRTARASIASIFLRDFAPQSFWVLKDPRQCVLLPLWREVFEDPENEIHFLHVVRYPRAVAKSLAKRDGASLGQALLLWLRHSLESERQTRGQSRAWILFEEMVADPKRSLEGACDRLGVSGELAFASKSQVFDEILVRSEVHHRGVDPDGPSLRELYPWVERSYRAFSSLVAGGEDPEALDELVRVGGEFEIAERILHEGLVVKMEALLAELAAHASSLEDALAVSHEYVRDLRENLAIKDGQLRQLWNQLQKRDAQSP